jgi:L,D-transpeptidase catalytic domain/Putative peptidoglycan binding domain
MSSTLRAVAVASSAALLIAGVATSAGVAGANPSAGSSASTVTVAPTYGPVNSTVTLKGSGFVSGAQITIGASAKTNATVVSPTELTAVVPTTATSGAITIYSGSTTVPGPTFVVQQATVATSTLSRTALVYRSPLTVTGTLVTQATAFAVKGESATLQHKLKGAKSWHKANGTSAKKTNSHGVVSWKVTPGSIGSYRVAFSQTHAYAAATSAAHGLRVFPRLILDHIRTVPAHTGSDLSGTIAPHVSGRVYLEKLVNGVWKHAGHTTISNGHFSFTISPKSLGSLHYRVVREHDGVLATRVSKPLNLTVVNRTITLGDSGPDVFDLEKRLHTLHYDIGTVSHSYEYDALHAVTAFEKVQGLPANGEVTTAVWKALNHPKSAHLKHPYTSEKYAVEVNLHKQVLIIAKYGKVWRILDTSTAGGYLYKNSSGGTSRAVTPTGHFTIQYKITGWHKSSLGELYYPSYFTNTGYAIHGEGNGNDGGEVPPYANSHGCVRITNDAVLRYYYKVFTVGTSVWVLG